MGDGIVLFGRPKDAHVAAVADELRSRDREVLHFDPSTYPRAASLGFRIGPASDGRHTSSRFDVDQVAVGWIGGHRDLRLSGDVMGRGRRFARAAALQGLDSFLRGCRFPWVNDPDAATVADDKLHQLGVAHRLGLEIPETLVTNDPGEFRRFRREHGKVVSKSIAGSQGLPASKRILTNVVRPRDVAEAESVQHAPVCFQEYVPKASELRVTVIGRRVHAVRIHSQATARTRDDWRRYGPALDYSRAGLPRGVRDRCVRLARELRLDYGGIDLVERPDGQHVFLEINTLPAWLWLEDATGEPITSSLADHLEARARRQGRGRGQERKRKGAAP